MFYIRADGNTKIGMGHVMRCLSVAEAAAEMDCLFPPVFILADEECRSLIEERGFQVIVLHTDYRDMMCELDLLETIFQKESASKNSEKKCDNIVLVDSYQAENAYYLALGKIAKTVCFEDMGEAHPVDLLINYNLYAPRLAAQYHAIETTQQTIDKYPQKVLLGANYMPLRSAFQEPSAYCVAAQVTNVTITTGGSDPYFATATLVDALLRDKIITEQEITLHLVSGPLNQFAEELKCRYQDFEKKSTFRIQIHEKVKDMRSLFLHSDVVITATGSTIYEVSSLGVPMIVFYFAENQRQGAEELERLTDIVNAGNIAKEPEQVTEGMRKALRRCIQDKKYRECLHRQEKNLIDAKGARRIAEQIRELCNSSDSA